MTDNDLVAAFDGWKRIRIGFYGTPDESKWQREEKNKRWMARVELYEVGSYYIRGDSFDHTRYMRYDKDWNLLMRACKKWECLPTGDFAHMEDYVTLSDALDDAVTLYEIKDAFKQLVVNIKWYNNLEDGNK